MTSRCSLTSGTRARRNSYFGLKSRQRLLIVVCQAGGWPRPLGLEGIEAIMFRTMGDRPSPWESLLPPEVPRLPGELARVDALLDDPAFFAPFAPHFHPVLGRPSTPAEWYLRLMFLKFRCRLGFESLCAEVSDSISWRRFCRIPLDGKGAAPDDADEADGPVRRGRGGGAERGAAGQGGRGEAAADGPAARRHHGCPGQRGLSDRFWAAGQGHTADRRNGAADPGRRRRDPHPGARSQPLGGQACARDRGQAAHAGRPGAGGGAGCGPAGHRGTRRAG